MVVMIKMRENKQFFTPLNREIVISFKHRDFYIVFCMNYSCSSLVKPIHQRFKALKFQSKFALYTAKNSRFSATKGTVICP